jgi:hypothetical protein
MDNIDTALTTYFSSPLPYQELARRVMPCFRTYYPDGVEHWTRMSAQDLLRAGALHLNRED